MRTNYGFVHARSIFPCADGYITIYVRFGPMSAVSMRAIVDWMAEDGMAPEWLREMRSMPYWTE